MKSSSGDTLTVHNPYDDSIVSSDVHVAGLVDVDSAVKAAKSAYDHGPWSKFTGAQRSACLLKFADLVEKNMDELARLESMSMGKPLSVLLAVDLPHMIGCYKCML